MPFYKELGNAGLKATDVPVVAFSVGEELRGVDASRWSAGVWNYFESIKTPVNTDFIAKWKAYAKAKNLLNAATVVTDPMEATCIGIHIMEAGRRAGQEHGRGQGHRGHEVSSDQPRSLYPEQPSRGL